VSILPAPLAQKYPYLISVAIHALILLLFALLSLQVEPQVSWHHFDWLMDPAEDVVASAAATTGDFEATASEPATEAPEASVSEQNPQVQAIESPLLESPSISNPGIQPSISRNPALTEALRSAQSNGEEGQNAAGYSSTLIEGGSDAFFIRESKPKIKPLEDDVVIVEFALTRDGRIAMNSVNVISYRRAAHWEALRDEMRNWRFGFTGAYDASKRYRIRCNFTLR
jgi:hypothetical protein